VDPGREARRHRFAFHGVVRSCSDAGGDLPHGHGHHERHWRADRDDARSAGDDAGAGTRGFGHAALCGEATHSFVDDDERSAGRILGRFAREIDERCAGHGDNG
jgi:hypothetical protein